MSDSLSAKSLFLAMANFCPHTALLLTDLTTTLACLFRTQSDLHDFC